LGTKVPGGTPGPHAGDCTREAAEYGNCYVLQDEVIRRLKIVEPDKQYTEEDCGVFYHAWLGQAKGRHVYHGDIYVLRAKNQIIQENVAAALAGDVIPLVEREVYYVLRGE
jgi:hypothetical protein